MLRVTVDLLPGGDDASARPLAVIDIANVSGPGRFSNDYAWRITGEGREPEYGYLLDMNENDAVSLAGHVLQQRLAPGLPRDLHGICRMPEGMPEDPSQAWTDSRQQAGRTL